MKYKNKKSIYKFAQANMIYFGCWVNGELVGGYRECDGGYYTKVKVGRYFYFTGVYPTISKAKQAIIKRLNSGT